MRTVELFAGAGGAALGLHEAGAEHVLCVERDPDAAATLAAAGFPALCIDVADWLDSAPSVGPVDLLWASPPCQPYSVAGKGLGAEDERDGWPLMLAAVEALRPRWVMWENVRGVPADQWCDDLRARGYAWAAWRLLNAADYGVPQHRRRVFGVAGPRPICWPRQTHCDPSHLLLLSMGMAPWVSCGEALGLEASTDAPSCTIATTDGVGIGGASSRDSMEDLIGARRFARDQAATLQAFPPDHPWQGSSRSVYRQIGNAVPPPLARAMMVAVMQAEVGHE